MFCRSMPSIFKKHRFLEIVPCSRRFCWFLVGQQENITGYAAFRSRTHSAMATAVSTSISSKEGYGSKLQKSFKFNHVQSSGDGILWKTLYISLSSWVRFSTNCSAHHLRNVKQKVEVGEPRPLSNPHDQNISNLKLFKRSVDWMWWWLALEEATFFKVFAHRHTRSLRAEPWRLGFGYFAEVLQCEADILWYFAVVTKENKNDSCVGDNGDDDK